MRGHPRQSPRQLVLPPAIHGSFRVPRLRCVRFVLCAPCAGTTGSRPGPGFRRSALSSKILLLLGERAPAESRIAPFLGRSFSDRGARLRTRSAPFLKRRTLGLLPSG